MVPSAREIQAAVAALDAGALVAYPTETLYGLGVRAALPDAVARLYKVKGLAPERGVSLLFRDFNAAEGYIVPTDVGRRLARRLLPGPVTLVFEASRRAPPGVVAAGGTVGVRVSPHPVASALALRGPITSTSANPHGVAAPETAAEIRTLLGAAIGVVLDGGRCPGPGSSVVDVRGDTPRLLRVGRISREAIEGATQA